MTKKKRKTYGFTRDGIEITDELIDKWAAEAELGYDISKLRPRPAAERNVVFELRLELDAHLVLMKRAQAEGITPGELARRLLRSELGFE